MLHYTALYFRPAVDIVGVMKWPCCPSVRLSSLSALENSSDLYETLSDVALTSEMFSPTVSNYVMAVTRISEVGHTSSTYCRPVVLKRHTVTEFRKSVAVAKVFLFVQYKRTERL